MQSAWSRSPNAEIWLGLSANEGYGDRSSRPEDPIVVTSLGPTYDQSFARIKRQEESIALRGPLQEMRLEDDQWILGMIVRLRSRHASDQPRI